MKSILLIKKLLELVEMMSGLVNASFSLPEWQAVKTGLKITDSRLPVMMTGQTPIPAGQIMNTNFFFLPEEYPIMLAIDRYYYTDVHIFDSKLVKNAFARCRVPFCGFRAF